MIGWGAAYGIAFGLVVLLARPLLPGLFAAAPPVRALLLAVLLVVAAQQPVAGVVFVLDGVLIGAGTSGTWPSPGCWPSAVFLPAAWLVHAQHRGLVALWLAYSLLAAGPVHDAGAAGAHGGRWLVTGAVRR